MLSQQIKSSGSLLDSIDAIRNWRAVLLLLATLVAGALVFGLGMLLGQVAWVFTALFALAAWLVVFYGANAAGMMVMDEARGQPSRPAMHALMTSLAISHRLILVFLLLGLIYLAGLLVLAIILFICKIPFVGPVLYAVVFPVSVVVVGIALFAVPTVVIPLAAPSIWSGAKTMECISQLLAIARKRLFMVLLLMIAVAFIAMFVGFLIGAVIGGGIAVTVGLSAAIIREGFGPLGMMMGGGMPMGGGGMGHAIAAGIGGGIVVAIASTLPGMVYLRGACTVYLRAVDGLDMAAEQAAMDEKLAAAKAKAREVQSQAQAKARDLQAQAQATAQQYAQRAPADAAAAAPVPAPPAYAPPPAYVPPPAPTPPPMAFPPASTAVVPPMTPPVAPPVAPPMAPPIAPHDPIRHADAPTVIQSAMFAAPPVAPAITPPAERTAPVAPPVAAQPSCPKCRATVLPTDLFCGECGQKL